MKPWYQHHHDKVIVPFYLPLHELSEEMGCEDYDSLNELGFEGICVSITIHREPADPETGIMTPTLYLDDIDVDHTDISLFREKIYTACESWVYTYEDDILSSDKVREAFEYFDENHKKVS